jgi:nitrogen regulatory protein P-II 1
MKKIDAIVKPFRLEAIVTRLRLIGVTGMTVTEVHGMSRSTAIESVFLGRRYQSASAPRCQVTIVVNDDAAAHIARAIVQAASTEEAGDGIVTVCDVVNVVRIRTGESGPHAL